MMCPNNHSTLSYCIVQHRTVNVSKTDEQSLTKANFLSKILKDLPFTHIYVPMCAYIFLNQNPIRTYVCM